MRRAAAWLATRSDSTPGELVFRELAWEESSPLLAAAVDPEIREGAFLLAGGDLATILWEMPEGAAYRKQWTDAGRTKKDLKTLTDPFDPLSYAEGLKGKRLMMIAGKVDEVVPPASAVLLWQAAGRPADPLVRLRTLLGGRLPACPASGKRSDFFATP